MNKRGTVEAKEAASWILEMKFNALAKDFKEHIKHT